jgi:uracil-DNA glycosylase
MRTENDAARLLERHVEQLRACRLCKGMARPAVSGGPVLSKVMLIGQAPGDKEPVLGRPFAWTAGKTLFRWFQEACGIPEADFRQRIYMAAVCRCFPGKNPAGGDRVPNDAEILRCSQWLQDEMAILRPRLVIPVGRLAISQFLPADKLENIIGREWHVTWKDFNFGLIPLPHPSGASTWHRMEPGKTLLREALRLISIHPAFANAAKTNSVSRVVHCQDGRGRPR